MKMRAHQKLCCGLSVLSRRCRWGRKWLGTTGDCRRLGRFGSCDQNQYQMDWTGLYWTGEHRYWLDIQQIRVVATLSTVSSRFSLIQDTGFTDQCTFFLISFPETIIYDFLTNEMYKKLKKDQTLWHINIIFMTWPNYKILMFEKCALPNELDPATEFM